MESIEQIREREFQEFKARWDQLFSPKETAKVARQMTGLQEEVQAYFRASNFHKDGGKKRVRSWTTFFADVAFYLEHRITRRVEFQGNVLLSSGSYDPTINIVNAKNIKPESIKLGIEGCEYEIDERAILPDRICLSIKLLS